MKKVLLLLVVMLLSGCNNNKSKTPVIDKKEVKKETSYSIAGIWISVNDHIVKDIVISTSNSETYNFKITFKDGGIKNQINKLNSKGEYHTNNRFGEYYKLRGETLGIYDKQGLIAHYKR
tara:strand:- start:581 stop:940 length:360 start_codon:yes stop_codon:yes gene_type:complete